MALFSHYAAQKAIYDVLTEDATLSGVITGVYDFVPAGTDYPYIVFGNSRVTDYSTVSTRGFQQALDIKVYSRARGRKEVTDIMECVYTLLHETTPPADTYTITQLRFSGSDVVREKDGLTYLGQMKFQILAEITN